MANTHETLTGLFTDIADAIRAKTGGTEPIVADVFPAAIAGIASQKFYAAVKNWGDNYDVGTGITVSDVGFKPSNIVITKIGSINNGTNSLRTYAYLNNAFFSYSHGYISSNDVRTSPYIKATPTDTGFRLTLDNAGYGAYMQGDYSVICW